MPYDAEISRKHPAAFVFVIDQSSSMNDAFNNTRRTLAGFLARSVNDALRELVNQCTRGDEQVRDYFHVAALGYSDGKVRNVWKDTEDFFLPISRVADAPLRIETVTIKVPDPDGKMRDEEVESEVWFEPVAVGDTPMVEALKKTRDIVAAWVKEHPASFPPIVFHVTDGEPTDGDPEPVANEIKALTTWDGAVLLFNLHVSRETGKEVVFPSDEATLPDVYAKKLFRMSSEIPEPLRPAVAESYETTATSRFFGFKAGTDTIAHFFQIGTRPANAPVYVAPADAEPAAPAPAEPAPAQPTAAQPSSAQPTKEASPA
ncbi:VWA domain-containing protein [Rhodoplanes sp. SY1]|uniref:VWA domain-containing protein n=1 Tax=Rhodoplanes sp. SY1 TaxID=3166646 RepID=UPI0038B50798